MPVLEPHGATHATDVPASRRMVTTLYDLIESLNTEAAPGEDDLVIAAMQHIVNTRQLTFLGLRHAHRVRCT